MDNPKFYFKCQSCPTIIYDMGEWFKAGQKCPECGGNRVTGVYSGGYEQLPGLIQNFPQNSSMWHYFDFLPLLDRKHIISYNEGTVDIDRWTFIETYARRHHNINCKVFVQRNDQHTGTGTFKDMAGSVVASTLVENNQKEYVVASTGNIANAFAKYLAAAGITLYAFLPENSSSFQVAGIKAYGQRVFRVAGDYTRAKEVATEFARKNNILLAAGNFDPFRIEAKKVMVYEWLRQMEEMPTVYIQALSGGTGPLGIQKAYEELESIGKGGTLPRQLLIQSNRCAPMADAWHNAKENNFPANWQNEYPIIVNPETSIPTLSTGNPQTYPVIGAFVKETAGEIFACDEQMAVVMSRLIAFETATLIGPAAALPIAGLFKALQKKLIRNGDVIMLNVGEGVGRSPDFMQKLADAEHPIQKVDNCTIFDRDAYGKSLWDVVNKHYT